MVSVCLYFNVHQAFQLRRYQSSEVEVGHCYEDSEADEITINRLADECYLPSNEIILEEIKRQQGKFSVSFSLSGTLLELLMRFRPDVVKSFQQLVSTGCVEMLGEPYYHSLSALYSPTEFRRQVKMHSNAISKLFKSTPSVFRNTELIHNNKLAADIGSMGFKGILCEGIGQLLKGRDGNRVYAAPDVDDISLLLRNVSLSDDIAFRFDDDSWNQYPLTAEKFAGWLHQHDEGSPVINLSMDYESFGIHKKPNSGIFDFLRHLPAAVLSNSGFTFQTPSTVLAEHGPVDFYDVPGSISWESRSAANINWTKNVMQSQGLKKIYSLEKMVMASGSQSAINTWGKLQAADYFYFMEEERAKGEEHKYASPFSSADETCHYYTNILLDFEISLIRSQIAHNKRKSLSAVEDY